MCDHNFHFLTSATVIQNINEFSIRFVKACKNFTTTHSQPKFAWRYELKQCTSTNALSRQQLLVSLSLFRKAIKETQQPGSSLCELGKAYVQDIGFFCESYFLVFASFLFTHCFNAWSPVQLLNYLFFNFVCISNNILYTLSGYTCTWKNA